MLFSADSNWKVVLQAVFVMGLIFSGQVMANEMVLIPGGKFLYGEEGKTVALKAFYIQKTEVTWEEYSKVVKDAYFEKGQEKRPATEINYFEAEAYCKSLGGRLPTQEEWEKAARGTDGRKFPWGNEFKEGIANTSETGAGGPMPVASFEGGKSPYGLYDMAGNVWEWVDAWDEAKRYRYVRGGSYFEDGERSTSFSRLRSIPDDMMLYYGFRCARDK